MHALEADTNVASIVGANTFDNSVSRQITISSSVTTRTINDSDYAECFFGNNGGSEFRASGNGGDHNILGSTGSDTLSGGAGDDTLDGSGGKTSFSILVIAAPTARQQWRVAASRSSGQRAPTPSPTSSSSSSPFRP